MTFTALKFPLYGRPNEIGTLLGLLKNPIHTVEGSGRETGWNLLMIDLLAAHEPKIYLISPIDKGKIDDIMYRKSGGSHERGHTKRNG